MPHIRELLVNNRRWAEETTRQDPGFFRRLALLQSPRFMWIGCSDSRVPANEIVGLLPGELFVHRNVANVVVHSDVNCLSVLQYAVDVLKVEHVIVCGHYGCGGVEAAWKRTRLGLIDNWLRHVQDVAQQHQHRFVKGMTDSQATDRLCELNVLEQVANVSRTTVVDEAWRRGQAVSIHGWIYRLQDGIIHDLGLTVTKDGMVEEAYDRALAALGKGTP